MPQYFKSVKGIQAYKQLDPDNPTNPLNEYPDKPYDKAYDEWFEKVGKKILSKQITKIIRVQTPDGEFLVYNEHLEGKDGLENIESHDRTYLGMYPIPRGRRTTTIDPRNNARVTKVTSIDDTIPGYEMPFTKENLEDLHKYANDRVNIGIPKTYYAVQRWNEDRLKTVLTYDDFMSGEFEDLYNNAKITKKDNSAGGNSDPQYVPENGDQPMKHDK